jgi:hypothetical protein
VSAREEGETTFLILRQEKCSVAVWDSSWPQRNVKWMVANKYAGQNRLSISTNDIQLVLPHSLYLLHIQFPYNTTLSDNSIHSHAIILELLIEVFIPG